MFKSHISYGVYRIGVLGYRIPEKGRVIKILYRTSLIRYMMFRRGEEAMRTPIAGIITIKGLSRYVHG